MAERYRRTGLAKALPLLLGLALLAGLLVVVNPSRALAAGGTVLFENVFNNRTVDGTGTVTLPTPVGGTNSACLSASGNSSTAPLYSCTSSTDAQGAGTLRLTRSTGSQIGGIFGATSFPTSSGLDVTFNTYQYGGGGADGIGFVLAAIDPTNPAAPTAIGPGGGSLGYSPNGGVVGLPNGYLGVGLDVYGNYSSPSWQGSGCASKTNITASVSGAVVVRGPGNGTVGYCGLSTSYTGSASSKATLRASTRTASKVPVEVLINPGVSSYTADSGESVAAGTYKVLFTPVGASTKTVLSGTLPTVPSSLYTSGSYVNADGYPKQLAFGFIGSTGGVNDFHEVSHVKVVTFSAVAQLDVSTTSHVAPSPAAGDPVTYVVTPSVQSGQGVNKVITMTQTTPTGVVPVGAFGSGWTCAAPSGQKVTCTTTASTFDPGTTLPPITVDAIVTSSGVTASTVQTGSTSAVSSENANPATDTTTTPGTLPTPPSGVTLSPAVSTTAGGGRVTISGSNLTAATAVEIGTTAEQQAGTPVVLLPCSTVITSSCFTVSGGSLVVSSWPSRASTAAVGVRVVTLGVQNPATTYTYAARPATPVAPTATAGVASATVSWTAPETNGSAITSYLVTPYLGGVAQSAITYDASTTTRTLTGLTVGGSYTFTVAAVNAYGTSNVSSASAAVVPYTLPGAPAVSSVSAGDSSATLTWAAPSSNGSSAITSYVVTPYIGTVAQTPVSFTGAGTTQTVTGLTPGTAYTFRVAAVNAAGTGPSSNASASVSPNASPSLTFSAPPGAEVGAAYRVQLTVNDGTSPYAWSVGTGALPAGLSLDPSTGLLSGTPTAAGSTTFTVQVVDASGQSATRTVTLVVAPRPSVAFSPAAGEVGVAYSQTPTVSGGTGPFTWAITAGSVPPGLSLDPGTGTVSGTPTAAGTSSLTLQATDAFAQTASRTASVVVAAPPSLAFSTSPPPQAGVAYSNAAVTSGGTGPFTYAVTAGSLPAGLSLDVGTGTVSGTPTTAGSSTFTLAVTDAFNQTATRVVTLVVVAGPVVITKTANVSSTTAGGTVGYTITVANTGGTTVSGISLSDPLAGVLDDATYNGNASATVGTTSYAAGTLGWTGTLAAGTTATITYAVTVASPVTGNQVLSNTVTSSTLGTNCAGGSADPRCTATVTVSALSITKTASSGTTTPGSTVRFTVVVTNTGRTAYAGATFTDSLADVLDDAAYGGDATATSGTLSFASRALTWTGNLAVGASATVTYTVVVADPVPGNRSLTGTVVSPTAGSTCPSGNSSDSCTATVTVLVPALSITDTAAVSTTTPGSTVGHTVTIANTGQTAATAATVAIALAGALDDATYAGDAATGVGSVAYAAGTQTLTWTGNLAVGVTTTVTFSVAVRNPDPGDRTLTTSASSSAPGSTCPPGSTSSACTSTVRVLVPALTIAKTSDVAYATPGSVVRYTVQVANTGQTAYDGATFDDDLTAVLDDATFGGGATATTGSVALAGSVVRWTGNLAVGASATITYSVTVRQPDPGDRSLSSTVTSTTPFSTCAAGGTDARCRSTVPVLVPGLDVRLSTDVASTIPGGTVRYTVTAKNTGQTAYAGATVLLGLGGALDDATSRDDFSVSTGSLTVGQGGAVTWNLDLPVGASATATGSVTVRNPDPGDRSLVATVSSTAAGSTCPTPSAGSVCTSTVPVLLPGLTLTKTADRATVQPGQKVVYTVTVVNSGQSVQGAASLTDPLDQVLTDATYDADATATAGTVTFAGSTLGWSGSLAVGASATITYSVTVRDPDPGDKLLTNTVVSTTPGSTCPSGSSDARCTVTVRVLVPQLSVVTTADRATTVPGGRVGYTLTVTNSGAVDQTAATVTDTITRVLDDAAYAGDATASTGSVARSGDAIVWTGALAVGASATITYSFTVNAADVGDDLLVDAVSSSTAGSTCTAGSTDPRCTVTVPVARLIIQRNQQETTATPGSTIHIPATYTNTGAVPYVGITVTHPRGDSADDVYPTGDDTATSGTLVRTDDAIRWTGDIGVGASVTVSITRVVRDPDPGNHIATAVIFSDAPGNNCPPGSTDPRCAYRIPILEPALTITKTASASFVVPGGSASFTVTIANTGETPYSRAVVTDDLSGVLDDATYTGATTTSGTLAYASPTLTWTGDLPVGATATVVVDVTAADPGTGDKAMINTVASAARGSTCPTGSSNAACRATVPVKTPGLTITKTADVTTANLGGTVRYTITVTNSGQTDYASASFTDPLTDVLDDATYSTATTTASRGTTSYAASTISWTGALAIGQSATISYRVTVKNPATGNLRMVNTVTSPTPGSTCAGGSTDARCTATVTVINATSTVTFTQTTDVAYAAPGTKVTYTIRVVNAALLGTTLAAGLSEPLDDVLDDATYNNDATASAGTVAVSVSPSGSSTLSWNIGLLALNSTTTITYSVTVRSASTGTQSLRGTLVSSTPLQSSNCTGTPPDPRCATTVPVARLRLAQSYTETSTTPGSLVRLTSTFTNTGGYPFVGITVTNPLGDVVDDAVLTTDQTASSGTLTVSASALAWTGNVDVGQTVTVRGTLTVRDPDPGDRLLTSTLVSAAPGSNCASGSTDPLCTARLPVLVPRLSITKTADGTFVVPGGTTRYTITIANTGETPYVGATVTDSLAGVLDDATYGGDATTSRGTLTYARPTLTWTGDLAVGTTATVVYTVTATNPGTGDKTMVNPVSSTAAGSTCPPGSSTAACLVVVPVLTPALDLAVTTSRATANPGAGVVYSVVATNTGQVTHAAATFDVPLAGLLDDATVGTATTTRGTLVRTGPALTWTGALAPDEAVTVSFTATVADPVRGDFRLTTTPVSSTAGSVCPVGTTNPRCASLVTVAGLRITNASDVTSTEPTGVVRYTGTFTNVGQVAYYGISVTDDFTAALDDATYGGDATATAGSLVATPGSGRIVWTGDLPVGATVTITGSITVRNPDPGDQSVVTRISTAAPGSNCAGGSTDPLCTVVVPVRTPRLAITSSTDVSVVGPGQRVRYTLSIANTGQTDYRAARVRQSLAGVLDDAAYGADVTSTDGAAGVGADELVWVGDVAQGQTVVVAFSVIVDAPDLADRVLASAVTSDEVGSSCPTGGSGSGCSTRVTVLVPLVVAAVVAGTTTTTPGSTVAYTVTVTNTGETDAPGAVLTVDLTGVLDDATYRGDATSTRGDATFAGTALTWRGDLVVGASATTTFTVLLRAAAELGDRSLVAALDTRIPGSSCVQGVGDASCRSTVAVLLPALAVTTTADRTTATPGDRVRLTLTVTNTGETDYAASSVRVPLADLLDDATLDGTYAASTGGVQVGPSELTWTGRLGRGESATLVFGAVVRPATALGDRRLVVTAVSADAGSTCPAGAGAPTCTATVTVLVPSLAIRTSASSPTTTPGAVVTHTTVITNDGQTPQTDVTVTTDLAGLLNEATYGADAQVSGGGVLDRTGTRLTWTGTLPVGATATVVFSVTVNNPATGDRQLTTRVSSAAPGSSCPTDGSGSASTCATVVQVLVPALQLTKTASASRVVAGSAVAYTITVANTGQTPYAPATFRDDLAGVLDDATYREDATATSGTLGYADGTLVWTGALAVGAAATITYTVDSRFPAVGDRTLRDTVVSSSPGSTCPVGTTRTRCRSEVGVLVPALSISKAADATSVVAGATLGYTITATNTGEADYASATVTDALAGVLDQATLAGSATATVGTVGVADRTLVWTGPLARGASVVITYAVTVDPQIRDGGTLVNSVASPTVGSTCPTSGAPAACTVRTALETSVLTLSGLTDSFRLTGLPGDTVERDGVVDLTVTTNSHDGYTVSVTPRRPTLTATATTDTIPVERLAVRPDGDDPQAPFTALDPNGSVQVHSQDRASAPGGDAVSNDYRVDIPFVDSAEYGTELEYVVTAR